MKLTRDAIKQSLAEWNQAWNRHDLDAIMDLFHEDILFENWTGAKVEGKEALRNAWHQWFENHGDFRFTEEDTFIDKSQQKVLYRWLLEWPSFEKGFEGQTEKRRGVDVIHFKDGKIIKKLTYSKTTLQIKNERIRLIAVPNFEKSGKGA